MIKDRNHEEGVEPWDRSGVMGKERNIGK